MNKFINYPYVAFELPYNVISLEPTIDKTTLCIHHDKIYLKYVEKLNYLIKSSSGLEKYKLEELLFNPYLIPANIITEFMYTAGGVYNHELFFNNLCNTKKQMKPLFKEKVINTFYNVNNFYNRIIDLSLSPINYNWIVAGLNKNKRLVLIGLKDNDTSVVLNICPLLVIDIAEHAYFIKYHNHLDHYVKNVLNIIDYDVVEKRLNDCLNHS